MVDTIETGTISIKVFRNSLNIIDDFLKEKAKKGIKLDRQQALDIAIKDFITKYKEEPFIVR